MKQIPKCHDCKKEIKYGYPYKINDEYYYKCKSCYNENSKLENYQRCEVYSRIVGYMRPTNQWNKGKQEEFKNRKLFKL